MVKATVILESIMNVCDVIISYSMEDLYVEYVIHFRRLCEKYPDFLKYFENTILDKLNLLMRHLRIGLEIVNVIYVKVETL